MSEVNCQLMHSRKPVKASRFAAIQKEDEEIQIPVCDSCFDLLFGKGVNYQVVEYDPTNEESGLKVVDREGRKVPEEKLWFYQKSKNGEIHDSISKAEDLLGSMRAIEWGIAEIVFSLKEKMNAADLLGYNTIYDITQKFGVDSKKAKQYCRVMKWIGELCNEFDNLTPEIIKTRFSPEEVERLRKMTKSDLTKEISDIM